MDFVHASDEQIDIPVVIVIGGGYADRVTRAGKIRFGGYVREAAVAVVTEQAI